MVFNHLSVSCFSPHLTQKNIYDHQPPHLARDPMREGYMTHCREALERYGIAVQGKLASVGHYHMWIASLKAETEDTRVICWVYKGGGLSSQDLRLLRRECW